MIFVLLLLTAAAAGAMGVPSVYRWARVQEGTEAKRAKLWGISCMTVASATLVVGSWVRHGESWVPGFLFVLVCAGMATAWCIGAARYRRTV